MRVVLIVLYMNDVLTVSYIAVAVCSFETYSQKGVISVLERRRSNSLRMSTLRSKELVKRVIVEL